MDAPDKRISITDGMDPQAMNGAGDNDGRRDSIRRTRTSHLVVESTEAFGGMLEHMQPRRSQLEREAILEWSWFRRQCNVIIESSYFEYLVVVLVLLNLMVVVLETDMKADGGVAESWVGHAARLFLSFYTVELLLKLYVYRFKFFDFSSMGKGALNMFEMMLVVLDYATMAIETVADDETTGSLPAFSILRVLRLVRLLRAVRLLTAFRELYLMVNGMMGAARAILWALLMIALVLTLFSIAAVQFIHPLNKLIADQGLYETCHRCPTAYSSVWNSMLTLFQGIIAGDSWGMTAVPILEMEPLAACFFIPMWLVLQLGLLNLILAVIIDQAAEAREQDVHHRLRNKQKQLKESKDMLTKICRDMDLDQDGELTLDELYAGYQEVEDFRNTLNLMDIGLDDINMVFSVIDQDKSGSCTYKEFVEEIYKLRAQDSHTLLVFIKSLLKDVLHNVECNQGDLSNCLRQIQEVDTHVIKSLNGRSSSRKITQQTISAISVEEKKDTQSKDPQGKDTQGTASQKLGEPSQKFGECQACAVKDEHREEVLRSLVDVTNRIQGQLDTLLKGTGGSKGVAYVMPYGDSPRKAASQGVNVYVGANHYPVPELVPPRRRSATSPALHCCPPAVGESRGQSITLHRPRVHSTPIGAGVGHLESR